MFLALTLWYGQPKGVVFLGVDYASHSQHTLVACSSLSRVEASWLSSVRVIMYVVVLVHLVLRQ